MQTISPPPAPQPLVQINCYRQLVTLTRRTAGGVLATYPIELEDLAIQLNQIKVSSGFLPYNVLAWSRVNHKDHVLWYVPPAVYTLTTTVQANKPKRWRVPLPGAIFTGHGVTYSVFAVKRRPRNKEAALYHFPAPNVSAGATICRGNAAFPTASIDNMPAAWRVFIASGFNDHGAGGRCRSQPQNILRLWRRLHRDKAKKFPRAELIASKTHVYQLIPT